MADHPERLKPAGRRHDRRRVILGAVAGVAVLLGMGWVLAHRLTPQTAREETATVQARPFSTSIDVVGTVVPGESIDVTAPFDGTIKAVQFEYGTPVASGDPLVIMDTFDIEQRRNDAHSAYLKASQAEAEMSSWANGPEVSRARRAATAADQDLKDTRRKAQETKDLLARGLVARMEYDGLLQQQRTQEIVLSAAQEDYAAALLRGEGPNRTEAAIDLQSAKARLSDIISQLAGATVIAPASGIVVRPPIDKASADSGDIHAGQRVSRGQILGSIAQAGALAVSFSVGEEDVMRVRVGQAVIVTVPGLGDRSFRGHIASVAGEATPAQNGAGGATFAMRALLDRISPAGGSDIRIGMTANVSIVTYNNPAALVAPPQAIIGSSLNASVRIRDGKSGRDQVRPVVLGHIAPDGVEIRLGLKAGDVVMWNDNSPQQSPKP